MYAFAVIVVFCIQLKFISQTIASQKIPPSLVNQGTEYNELPVSLMCVSVRCREISIRTNMHYIFRKRGLVSTVRL